jgi:hypothetical protein
VPDMKPESWDAVTQANKRHQHVGDHCIRNFPRPDYSKTPPRVDTCRRNPKIGVEGKVPFPDDALLTSNQQASSHTLMRNGHWEENLESVNSVKLISSPAKINAPILLWIQLWL